LYPVICLPHSLLPAGFAQLRVKGQKTRKYGWLHSCCQGEKCRKKEKWFTRTPFPDLRLHFNSQWVNQITLACFYPFAMMSFCHINGAVGDANSLHVIAQTPNVSPYYVAHSAVGQPAVHETRHVVFSPLSDPHTATEYLIHLDTLGASTWSSSARWP